MTQTAASPAGSFREMFRAAHDRQDLCVIAILAWVASRDAPSRRGRELLDRFAEGLPNLPEVGRVIDAVIPSRPDDLELACRHVRNRMDRGGKRLLLQLAITTAVQDGFLSVGENWVLQFLADLLDVSPRKFARLFAEISHRPFPTAGDPSSIRWWRDRQAGIAPRPAPECTTRRAARRAKSRMLPEPMTRAAAWRARAGGAGFAGGDPSGVPAGGQGAPPRPLRQARPRRHLGGNRRLRARPRSLRASLDRHLRPSRDGNGMKDLYKRLGVEENAAADAISRRLPAGERAEIRAAAEFILLDEHHRRVYDRNRRLLVSVGQLPARGWG